VDEFVARFRQIVLRLPLSRWMLVLVVLAVLGYGVMGLRYYVLEMRQEELFKNNSIYIELEQAVQGAKASHRIAVMAAHNAAALPVETVRSTAAGFVDAARAAGAANKVAALDARFATLQSAATIVEQSISGSSLNLPALREGLHAATDVVEVLALIGAEGRASEWQNLTSGSRSDFEALLALIIAGALMVGSLGYLVTANIRNVFAEVIRINGAIADGKFEVDIPPDDDATEAGKLFAALRVFRDNSAARARLEASAKSDETARTARQRRIEKGIEEFRRRVQQLLEAVGDNMNQMQGTAKLLTRSAEDTSARASGAAKASEHASSNVQTVAAAAEELAASISEINHQAMETSGVVTRATESARFSTELVARLTQAAQKIGEVVNLIRAIADQTNLLALNATIEAARAGDMGRGFAVVASEVKTLAGQTAKATEEIAGQISAIQDSIGQSAQAIKVLAATMEEVNSYTAAIAGSVERQGAATTEISSNVHAAASETQKVAANMAAVTSAVSETMRSAAMVAGASNEVVARTAELRQAVNLFLDDVAAA
jgi:methyl-accepting chemotaxis protein